MNTNNPPSSSQPSHTTSTSTTPLSTNPTQYMVHREHPVPHVHHSISHLNDPCPLVAFFSLKCFSPAAKGWRQFRSGNAYINFARQYNRVLDIFGYLANELSPHTPVECFYELVKNTEKENVGFRLWLFIEHRHKSMVQKLLNDLFAESQTQTKKNIKKGGAISRAESTVTSIDDYTKMCQAYFGPNISLPSAAEAYQMQGDLDPFECFSVHKALSLARGSPKHPFAAPEFCTLSNYQDADAIPRFPFDGQYVYHIRNSELIPATLGRYFFPHEKKFKVGYDPEFEEYCRLQIGDMYDENLTEEDNERFLERQMERLRSTYDSVVDRTAGGASDISFESLREIIFEKMDQAKIDANGDYQKHHDYRRDVQRYGLDLFFRLLFVEDSTEGTRVSAAARYYKRYLEKHNNTFRMYFPKVTSNLSRNGDMHACYLKNLHRVAKVEGRETIVMTMYTGNCYVYFFNGFNHNTLLPGKCASGKTFVQKLVGDLHIPGTHQAITYVSDKGYAAPGKTMNGNIENHDDVLPSFLAIRDDGSGKKTATNNSDLESMNKSKLTTGIIYPTILVTNKDGQRVSVQYECHVKAAVNVNTNASAHHIPESMRSRYNVIPFDTRPDDDSLGRKVKEMTPAQQKEFMAFQERMRRNQLLCVIVCILIKMEILAQIEMTAAYNFLLQVLIRAKAKGISETSNVRHFERMGMKVKILVLNDAFDAFYDSDASAVNGIPHDIEHFLWLEKYFVSKYEHGTLAIGWDRHQYVCPIQRSIMAAVSTLFRSWTPVKQNARIKDKYVQFDALDEIKRKDGNFKRIGARRWQFARFILPHMKVKFEETDVVEALKQLSQQKVRSVYEDDESDQIPTLQFFEDGFGEVKIAYTAVLDGDSDIIKECAQEVLSHTGCKKQTLLYGRPEPDVPFIYQTIEAGEAPVDPPKLKVQQTDYFDDTITKFSEAQLLYEKGESAGPPEMDIITNFNNVPFMNIDEDLEKWGALNHELVCVLDEEDKKRGLSHIPWLARRQAFKKWNAGKQEWEDYKKEELMDYTSVFPHRDAKRYQQDMEAKFSKPEYAEETSLKTRLKRLREHLDSQQQPRKRSRMVDTTEEQEEEELFENAENESSRESFEYMDESSELRSSLIRQSGSDDSDSWDVLQECSEYEA